MCEREDLGQTRPAFIEAVDTYASLGAEWDIRGAIVGARPGALPVAGTASARRIQDGCLVAKGLSNPDIAAQLLLSRRTVQTHVSHILTKLDARSRSEIARAAADHAPADLGPGGSVPAT